MASYQDLEVRVKTVEEKIDFIMNSMRMAAESTIVGAPPKILSLLDLYLASKNAGLRVVTTEEQYDTEKVNG